MSRYYHPRGFSFIEIKKNSKPIIKLFACFGDSWKLNSGCVEIREKQDCDKSMHEIVGHSSSIYTIVDDTEGQLSGYSAMVFYSILDNINAFPGVSAKKISLEEAIKAMKQKEDEQ